MKEDGDAEGVDSVRLQFVATGLDRKDTLGSSDPYLVISQVKPDGSRVRVYQSPVLMNTLNPTWPAHRHYLPLLCNSDPVLPLVAEVWDWNKSEAHELIGTVASPFNLENLLDAPDAGTTFPLVDPKRIGKKGYDQLRRQFGREVGGPGLVGALEGHAAAGPSPVQPQHKSGLFRRAAMDHRIDA